jgi:coenzyme F420-reducing hydrogenase gamma subunit
MKQRIAFFDFACCEGCQLQVLNLEEDVIGLAKAFDIVSFREAMKEHSDHYDIAFVEGSIVRPVDEERLKEIRRRADVLVALGACACMGGVNAIRNEISPNEVKQIVYGKAAKENENNPYFDAKELRAVDEVVRVDYYIPGCPVDKDEFKSFMTQIAIGKKPELPNYPVCVECKANGNICLFDQGKFCLGPVIRAGCKARCPTYGYYCWGCRGLIPEPNLNAEKEVLQKHGLTPEDIISRFKLFCSKFKGGKSE